MAFELEMLLRFLIERGRDWIVSQGSLHRRSAKTLTPEQKLVLSAYFTKETLDLARIRSVPRIENPEFYSTLRTQGIAILLDFTPMSGITFVDTILLSESQKPLASQYLSLIFHELVHVVQYRKLGLDRFVERYVRGWAESGFQYQAIPLEAHAYELQKKFELAQLFSVDDKVIAKNSDY